MGAHVLIKEVSKVLTCDSMKEANCEGLPQDCVRRRTHGTEHIDRQMMLAMELLLAHFDTIIV